MAADQHRSEPTGPVPIPDDWSSMEEAGLVDVAEALESLRSGLASRCTCLTGAPPVGASVRVIAGISVGRRDPMARAARVVPIIRCTPRHPVVPGCVPRELDRGARLTPVHGLGLVYLRKEDLHGA